MKYLNPHNAIIELERLVSSNDSEIKLQSNGGNSILLVCKPSEEVNFISELHQLEPSKYQIIDLNQVLVEFVENNEKKKKKKKKNRQESLDLNFKNNLDTQPVFF